MMRRAIPWILTVALLSGLSAPAKAISRHPTGVNVNAHGATSVFITFGNLVDQVPVEASWCGELIPAAPDLGFRCDPATLFGRLPIRYDQSRLAGSGAVFTDVMSIPPSVARRAYQAALRGETSSFFYVRRFASTTGGPDEYVFVTCRLTGGGARTPFSLLHVDLAYATEDPILSLQPGQVPPPLAAEILYTGSGRLKGRWEIVLPGQEPPTASDLLTEATLPPEERALQRRYTVLERFNVFLPPTGRTVLPGPAPRELPTDVEGLYLVLLRIEASDDKEAESDLAAAEAGQGVVRAGAVAGFPIPPLRYVVGSVPSGWESAAGLVLLAPLHDASVAREEPLDLSWNLARDALLYRLEISTTSEELVHAAVLQQGIATYRAPSWLQERLPGSAARWRVVALGPELEEIGSTAWRPFQVETDGTAAAAHEPQQEGEEERGEP